MPEIETSRLRLRMLSLDDVDDFAAIFADPEAMKFIGIDAGTVLSRAETSDVLQRMIAFWKRNGFGRWAVINKTDQKLIGLCGLRLLDGEPELFYLFAKASWGKGFATEAAAAVIRYGFEELKFDRIIAVIRSGNAASLNVVRKIGMRTEEQGNRYGLDVVRFVATRSEFQPVDSSNV